MESAIHMMLHTGAARARETPTGTRHVSRAYDSDVLPRFARMSRNPTTFLIPLGLTTAIYTVTNNAISSSVFADNVPVSVVVIVFCALLFWYVFLQSAVNWLMVHGRLSGGDVEEVASHEISFVTTLLTGAFVTVTISVMIRALQLWSLALYTQIAVIVAFIFVVVAVFASLGLNL